MDLDDDLRALDEMDTVKQLRAALAKAEAERDEARKQRDALRYQIENGGCAASHYGEHTYECRVDNPCGLCRIRARAEKAEAERDEAVESMKWHRSESGRLKQAAHAWWDMSDVNLARAEAAEVKLAKAVEFIHRVEKRDCARWAGAERRDLAEAMLNNYVDAMTTLREIGEAP